MLQSKLNAQRLTLNVLDKAILRLIDLKLNTRRNNGSIKYYHNDYQRTRKIVDNLSLILTGGMEGEGITGIIGYTDEKNEFRLTADQQQKP